MDERRPSGDSHRPLRLTRRRFVQWIPGIVALGASAGAAPVAADVLPPGAHTAPPPVSPTAAFDLSLRSRQEATAACTKRRYWEEQRGGLSASPLESMLGIEPLTDSRLGLVNWPLVDETEDLNLGHFVFPISPFNTSTDDGHEEFVLFSNTQIIANFRSRDYLEQVQRRIFDRAVWAMYVGRIGSAIVEFDRPISDLKAQQIVRLLSYFGVKTVIWGNELNDPQAPWRDDLPALFDVISAAAEAKNKDNLPVEFCLPGLAYYGQGEYMLKMLRTFKQLQAKKYPKDPDNLPVQRVADHFYGPVDTFLQRITMMRGVMASEGLKKLKYDVTEVGNPSVGPGTPRASDQQMAEGYIPQIASLAVGSGLVDRVSFYSTLDPSDDFSFMSVSDSRLVKKTVYRSLVVMAKLLSRVGDAAITDEQGIVHVRGWRTDGLEFEIAWSKAEGNDLWMDVQGGKRIFDVMGQEAREDRPGQIVLKPKQHPVLGGPARILVGPRRKS